MKTLSIIIAFSLFPITLLLSQEKKNDFNPNGIYRNTIKKTFTKKEASFRIRKKQQFSPFRILNPFHYKLPYPIEVGINTGTSHFLGEVGGEFGKEHIFRLNAQTTGSVLGAFFKLNLSWFAIRIELNFIYLTGNDKFPNKGFDPITYNSNNTWQSFYRNLSFRSFVFESLYIIEVSPFYFEIGKGHKDYKILSIYGLFGIGFFVFNPEALYEGAWIELKPLSTEGQGLTNIREYSLFSLNSSLGGGIKLIYNDTWALALELNYRLTFTDYIDDVSRSYVDPTVFTQNFDASKASIAIAMARRSVEIDPQGINSNQTTPSKSRGNFFNNDSYYTISIRLSFFLENKWPKNNLKYNSSFF